MEQSEQIKFSDLGLCEELCDACERLNFKIPTKIQIESLPYSLKKRDVIGLAETGSGKTLAFSMPILQSLLEKPQANFALILAPTRELCIGIQQQMDALGTAISLRTVVIVGGLDAIKQAIALQKKPHVIIATPGRLFYHLQNTKGFNLKNLKYLVLDEADKLLNMDFEKDINNILQELPKERTTLLFSATMTNKVSKLQRMSLNNPVKVEASSKYQTVSTLDQRYLFIPAKNKDVYLVYLLNELSGNQIIVFVNTVMNTIRLTFLVRNLGFKAVCMNGQMSQERRVGSLNKFKAQEQSILIATDVATRGLDIQGVDMVINYDLPQNSKEYVHRVGRTARAGKAGRAIAIVTQYDVEKYQMIEHLIDKKLEAYAADEGEVMLFAERVEEAQRIANQEVKNLIEKKEKGGTGQNSARFDESDAEGDQSKKGGNRKVIDKESRKMKNRKKNGKGRGFKKVKKLDF